MGFFSKGVMLSKLDDHNLFITGEMGFHQIHLTAWFDVTSQRGSVPNELLPKKFKFDNLLFQFANCYLFITEDTEIC